MMDFRLLLGVVVLLGVSECADRVLLKDVTAITLTADAKTNGRRSSPVPQLTCTGGTAFGKVSQPNIVQCRNVGFDGLDVQWECKADLDSRVKFGRISVSCEGYSHPQDPYVLKGSCGLEYELNWKGIANTKRSYSERANEWLSVIIFLCVAAYLCYSAFQPSRREPSVNLRFGSGFDGGPPGGGHPGYPGSGPPPKYNDLFGSGNATNAQAGHQGNNDGPGFWTGAGLGSLGGYFFGRQQNDGSARFRGARTEFDGTAGFSSSDYVPNEGASTSHHIDRSTSTGYGETTRR